jgi:hypothetical protein
MNKIYEQKYAIPARPGRVAVGFRLAEEVEGWSEAIKCVDMQKRSKLGFSPERSGGS